MSTHVHYPPPQAPQQNIISQAFCEVCGKPIERDQMEGRCVHCGKLACKTDGRRCSVCSVVICQHCWKVCQVCGLFLCRQHAKEKNGKFYCDEHLPKGCFIATAAYGTPFAREINVLRNWRDNELMPSKKGKLFVITYYKISPPIAKIISTNETLKKTTRYFLKPIVRHFNKKYKEV